MRKHFRKHVVIAGLLGLLIPLSGCQHSRFLSNQTESDKAEYLIEYLSDELELSQEQQKKVNDSIINFFKLKNKLHTPDNHEDELIILLTDETIDTQVLKQSYKQKIEKLNKAIPQAIDQLAEFHKILTPTQRKKLASLMKNRRHRGKHR